MHDPDYPLCDETLGLWKLSRGIGRGGMGEVYEAEYDYLHLLTLRYQPSERGLIRRELEALPRSEQSRLASDMLGTPLPEDASFAIKVCSARSGTAGHRRFIQEAELAKRLGDHPYIVTIHAVNNGDGAGDQPMEGSRFNDVAFMVMDLAVREYDHTALSITESVHMVRCIATALDHAHQHGVVHRDLKPENILGSIEHPYLTDFGIAKELDHSLGLTRTGQVIGTLDYMSPEQATDAKNVDRRSDIYSLGVVLYECASRGHLPYIHLAEREAALSGIRSERIEPKWPRDHVPDFPRGLEHIILKAIAHRPDERYQEMSDLIRDLDRWSRGDWLPVVGRVHPRRWCRHMIQAHPRLAWGIPAAMIFVVLVWLVIMFPTWFDERRNEIERGLATYEEMVERIERRNQQQLDPTQEAELVELRKLTLANSENYRELADRFFLLDERRRHARYLQASFSSSADVRRSRDELAAAANIQSPNWDIREDGLHFNEPTPLQLGPYGHGRVVVSLSVQLPDPRGFELTVTELEDVRHVTRLGVSGGTAVLTLTQDEQPPEILHRSPIGAGDIFELPYLSVDGAGVRAWMPDRLRPHRAMALSTEAAAQVRIFLPQGAILRDIQIWPEGGE